MLWKATCAIVDMATCRHADMVKVIPQIKFSTWQPDPGQFEHFEPTISQYQFFLLYWSLYKWQLSLLVIIISTIVSHHPVRTPPPHSVVGSCRGRSTWQKGPDLDLRCKIPVSKSAPFPNVRGQHEPNDQNREQCYCQMKQENLYNLGREWGISTLNE